MEGRPLSIFQRSQVPPGIVLTGAPPGFSFQQQTMCNFQSSSSNSSNISKNSENRNDAASSVNSPDGSRVVSCRDLENALLSRSEGEMRGVPDYPNSPMGQLNDQKEEESQSNVQNLSFFSGRSLQLTKPKSSLLPTPIGPLVPSPKGSHLPPPPGFGAHGMRGPMYMVSNPQAVIAPPRLAKSAPLTSSQPQPWSPALLASRQQKASQQKSLLHEPTKTQETSQNQAQSAPRQLQQSPKDVIRKLQELALSAPNIERKGVTQIHNLAHIEQEVFQNQSNSERKVEKKPKWNKEKKNKVKDKPLNEDLTPQESKAPNKGHLNREVALKNESEDDRESKKKKKRKRKKKKEKLEEDGDQVANKNGVDKDKRILKPGLFSQRVVLTENGDYVKKQAKESSQTHEKRGVDKDKRILKPGLFSQRAVLTENGDYVKKQAKESSQTPEKRGSNKIKKGNENFEPYLPFTEVERRMNDKTLIEGEFRINVKKHSEAYITDPETGSDILILGFLDRNRSLEGDIVAVEIKDEEHWLKQKNGSITKTGKVVYILERVHHCHTVGTLRFSKGIFMLVSRDPRFPLLKIPTTSIPKTVLSEFKEDKKESNTLCKGLLLSWHIPKYANGMIKESVGKKGDINAETAAILAEFGLNKNPIPSAFNKFLPNLPYLISDEDISSRLDLRSEVIFTIDPATARDLDDAVSIKALSDGDYEVGVHISDVTHFLKEGTPLDVEVSERATTVYMVERAYHMLPIELCGLCSLLPGEDKLAISVIFKLDIEGNILDTKFSRTVINSCAQLSYDHAQAILDGEDVELPVIYNNVSVSSIREAILNLNKIALNRRKRRFDTGALRIDQPKVCFDINSDCIPQTMFIYELKDSNRLIEEFMLLANEAVAKYIHSKFPEIALLRRHDPPKVEMMNKLASSLQKLGIFLDLTTAGSLYETLTKYTNDDIMRATVLNQLCAKPMNRAMYFCSSEITHHYALNLDKYTHFTSPIRRYADIVVHRVLTSCLGYTKLPSWNKEDVNKFASTSNRKKYAAKRAGDKSSDFYRIVYIKNVGEVITDAVITWVNSRSVDITVPSMALNIRVYLDQMDFEYNDNDIGSSLVLKWAGGSSVQVLQVFCTIKVSLRYSEKLDNIEAKLVPPDFLMFSEKIDNIEANLLPPETLNYSEKLDNIETKLVPPETLRYSEKLDNIEAELVPLETLRYSEKLDNIEAELVPLECLVYSEKLDNIEAKLVPLETLRFSEKLDNIEAKLVPPEPEAGLVPSEKQNSDLLEDQPPVEKS